MNRKVQKTRQKNGKTSPPFVDLESKKGLLFLVGLVFFAALAAMGFYVYTDHGYLPKGPVFSQAMALTSVGQSRKPPLVLGQEYTVGSGADIRSIVPLLDLSQKTLSGNSDLVHGKIQASEFIHEKTVTQINKPSFTVNEPDNGNGQGDLPVYEVFDTDPGAFPGRGDVPGAEDKEGLPRVAIIIDDVGFDKAMAMAFSRLSPNITMAILPGSPFGRDIADRLYVRDAEIMLHLPMEPVQYPEVNPGPGALMADMAPDLFLETLRKDLDSIPHFKGVNNHMGSRLTTLPDQMRQVFTVLKKKDLFFIDSLTARYSICRDSARLLQLSFARRDVFLDNIQDKNYIIGQIQELIQISQRHGSAIGIGHPYPATLETLALLFPEMQEKVSIVRASELAVTPD